jgi:hypothetical protein
MATITFENGTRVDFHGTPTQRDIEEVAASIGLSKSRNQPANPQVSEADQRSADLYHPTFPAKSAEGPLAAGLKTAGNLPSSAFNLAKTVVDAVAHPVRTAEALGDTVTGALDKHVAPKLGLPQDQRSVATFEGFAEAMKERYGSPENIQRSITNDPVGVVTDFLSLFGGGAAAAGKAAEVSKAVSASSRAVTEPIKAVGSAIADKTAATAKFATSQATGLQPETISAAVQAPKELSAAQTAGLTRSSLGTSLKEVIDRHIEALTDLGQGYRSVREAETPVTLPEGWFDAILQRHKINTESGKITTTKESTVLSPADVSALQAFYDLYGREAVHTPNSFLNTRDALAQLARYDAAKTGNLEAIARDARTELKRSRNQIPTLKELDEEYAPFVDDLKLIKREWIDQTTGDLKDNALTRIANATNAGRDQILERLEMIQPGITKQIKLLRAIENIEKAKGNTVGTYTRSAIAGGGLLTGNIPLIVGAIIAQPEIAIPLLKGLGYTKRAVSPIIQALKSAGSDINNFRLPAGLRTSIAEGQPGLSMKKSPVLKSEILKAQIKDLEKQLKHHPEAKTRRQFAKQLTALKHELDRVSRKELQDWFASQRKKKKDAK